MVNVLWCNRCNDCDDWTNIAGNCTIDTDDYKECAESIIFDDDGRIYPPAAGQGDPYFYFGFWIKITSYSNLENAYVGLGLSNGGSCLLMFQKSAGNLQGKMSYHSGTEGYTFGWYDFPENEWVWMEFHVEYEYGVAGKTYFTTRKNGIAWGGTISLTGDAGYFNYFIKNDTTGNTTMKFDFLRIANGWEYPPTGNCSCPCSAWTTKEACEAAGCCWADWQCRDCSHSVTKVWTLSIGGQTINYTSINFTKTHPSPYPDTFEVILPYKDTTISTWNVVAIYKNNVLIFYGYVERKEWTSDVETMISGRCRKVIMWKKWTERFEEARKGMEGFFGFCSPEEIFKFFLRCPVSDIPTEDEFWRDFPLCKIGWGINAEAWATSSNNSSAGTHPIYARLRMPDFVWRNRGNENLVTTLIPNGDDGSAHGWTDAGACGAAHKDYVDAVNDGCEVHTSSVDVSTCGYHFQNLSTIDSDASGIVRVRIGFRMRCEWLFVWGAMVRVRIDVWDNDNTTWNSGYFKYWCQGAGNGSYYYGYLDVTDYINSVSQVDNIKVKFTRLTASGITSRIDYVFLSVTYTNKGSQESGDWFKIDLGRTYSRVCGVIVQSRRSDDQYPRNYKVECAVTDEDYSTLGDTTEYSSWHTCTAGSAQVAGPYTTPAAGCSLRGLWVYIRNANGDQLKAIVYDRSGGIPNALIGTGTQVTISVDDSIEYWQWLPFASPVALAGSTPYYFGFCQAAGDSVQWACWTGALTRYGDTGVNCTPNNPWTNDETDASTVWSIYAVYGGDYTTMVSVTGNTCRDIIHSWIPRNARFIRISITTSDASHSWEISQIYVYEADEYKYCVVEEP